MRNGGLFCFIIFLVLYLCFSVCIVHLLSWFHSISALFYFLFESSMVFYFGFYGAFRPLLRDKSFGICAIHHALLLSWNFPPSGLFSSGDSISVSWFQVRNRVNDPPASMTMKRTLRRDSIFVIGFSSTPRVFGSSFLLRAALFSLRLSANTNYFAENVFAIALSLWQTAISSSLG